MPDYTSPTFMTRSISHYVPQVHVAESTAPRPADELYGRHRDVFIEPIDVLADEHAILSSPHYELPYRGEPVGPTEAAYTVDAAGQVGVLGIDHNPSYVHSDAPYPSSTLPSMHRPTETTVQHESLDSI